MFRLISGLRLRRRISRTRGDFVPVVGFSALWSEVGVGVGVCLGWNDTLCVFFKSNHFIHSVRNVHNRETEQHYLNIVKAQSDGSTLSDLV